MALSGGRDRTVEAHLLDLDRDIYGQTLGVAFDRRVRPEERFAGLDDLTAQIAREVAGVHVRLASSL